MLEKKGEKSFCLLKHLSSRPIRCYCDKSAQNFLDSGLTLAAVVPLSAKKDIRLSILIMYIDLITKAFHQNTKQRSSLSKEKVVY